MERLTIHWDDEVNVAAIVSRVFDKFQIIALPCRLEVH
jgi:hypothetical protein